METIAVRKNKAGRKFTSLNEVEEDKILCEFAREREGILTGKEKEGFEHYLESI
ncbi:hypothetical protein Barb6XT_00842 [Bacteroidales bacterium Barb6XT]|nr:hypothetical protein Barb6XT_00842 [Bacteroidales bacterium Barb6XT]